MSVWNWKQAHIKSWEWELVELDSQQRWEPACGLGLGHLYFPKKVELNSVRNTVAAEEAC